MVNVFIYSTLLKQKVVQLAQSIMRLTFEISYSCPWESNLKVHTYYKYQAIGYYLKEDNALTKASGDIRYHLANKSKKITK